MISPKQETFSILELKVNLHNLIREGCLDARVTELLFDHGKPLPYERQFWDFKLRQPTHTRSKILSKEEKYPIEREWGGLIKDIISFYNSYGGYIVFGVADTPRTLVGFVGDFDVDELNRRVSSYTKNVIECTFRVLEVPGMPHSVGVLLVPQRPDSEGITLVRKDGPPDAGGKPLFTKGTVFLRKGDSCGPAEEPEDFQFLISVGRRSLSFATAQPVSSPALINNLPPRDPSFIEFIGREKDLVGIWNWFLDEHSPVKLLSGFGGVGKTTLVREFVEDVVRTSPSGIEKVVWLSAKQAVYTAIQGRYHLASRVDFTDVISLLKAILNELGEPEVNYLEIDDKDELVEQLIENLVHLPALLVVDDLDSLPLDLQQEAFHTLLHSFITASAKAPKASKCMITARLDLGAAPSQLLKIRGLVLDDFFHYVVQSAETIDLPWHPSGNSQIVSQFHSITEGSPIFADAVLRLISLGEHVEDALKRWKGADGEEVRKFAFERELSNLTDSQIRTLYAALVLGQCYLEELVVILNSNSAMLRDAVAELRKYHLLSSGSSGAQGISLAVPSSLQLMRDVVRKRVHDPKRIDDECARLRSQSNNKSLVAGRITQRVVAIWQDGDSNLALDVAKQGVSENSKNPDLYCLLGRAYLRLSVADYKNAEINFREASTLGCNRQELPQLWVEAKVGLLDWKGLLDITVTEVNNKAAQSEVFMHRATAYRELANSAIGIGDSRSAASWFRAGGLEISEAFDKRRAVGNVLELRELKTDFFSRYVFLTDELSAASGDHLDVWLAVREAFAGFVRRPVLLRIGFSKLKSWWQSVARRDNYDPKALQLARTQIAFAREMLAIQRKYDGSNGPELSIFMEEELNFVVNGVEDYSHR